VTPQEAEGRIPIVAKRVALEAVDLVIALDKYPVDTMEVERRVWSLSGQAGYLARLCHVIWKKEAFERILAKQTK